MKLRCFRIRRRLLQFWRHFRSRRRHRRYHHLNPSSALPRLQIACKVLNWGRDLTRAMFFTPQRDHERLRKHKRRPSKGHLVVYVGEEDEVDRFEVPIAYINHPLFQDLLKEAEKEFGFNHPGAITLPCPVSDFESIRSRIRGEHTHGTGG